MFFASFHSCYSWNCFRTCWSLALWNSCWAKFWKSYRLEISASWSKSTRKPVPREHNHRTAWTRNSDSNACLASWVELQVRVRTSRLHNSLSFKKFKNFVIWSRWVLIIGWGRLTWAISISICRTPPILLNAISNVVWCLAMHEQLIW